MAASGGSRTWLSVLLCVLATVALIAALVGGYAKIALFSADGFADRAAASLDDEAVRSEIATRVTDDVVLNANADLVAVRPVIEDAVDGLVRAGLFQSLFRTAVRDVHRAFFEGDKDTVTLTLADVGTVLRGALQALQPKLEKDIGAKADVEITPITPPAWVSDVARTSRDLSPLPWVLLALGLLLAVAAVWVARDRRRALLALGISIVVGGVTAAVAMGVVRTVVLAGIDESGVRDAVRGIWDAYLDDLRNALYVFAGCGAVIAAAASSLLRPVDIGEPLRATWARIAHVPERTWLRVARALAFIAVGILVIANRDAVIDLVVLFAGLYIAYAGVSELLRMTIAPVDDAERAAEAGRGRRALVTAGIASAVIIGGGAAFIASGGTREPAQAIETVGCNGSRALCDRPLDEVAIPMTHNAMSAVTNKNWLFGQQDAGFPEQLTDGIRGLAIDAHYGRPTESGEVKTDLSNLSSGERATYEQELGTEALDAALRIRDRIVSSKPTGPRAVYLCHRFCELGAIPIDAAFRQFRDFLAANPDEVLVVVIEDYVKPTDIKEAVQQSGLIAYVYDGPLDPSPTLQEMIDSGGRMVVMAEKDAGGGAIPWYHPAYKRLVAETPYSFPTPAALIGKRNLDASCKPNRGPRKAPYFLINHWVDTSPAPKPSNAERANEYRALLHRVHRCERDRNMTANLISVDFYREGDLFKVIDALNDERGGSG